MGRKGCVEEEGSIRLRRLLLCVVQNSVRVSVDVALVTLTCAVLMGAAGMLEQLNLNTRRSLFVCALDDAQLLYGGNNK